MNVVLIVVMALGLAAAVAYDLSEYSDRPLRDNVLNLLSHLRHPKDGAQ
jgi:hypothetical protein